MCSLIPRPLPFLKTKPWMWTILARAPTLVHCQGCMPERGVSQRPYSWMKMECKFSSCNWCWSHTNGSIYYFVYTRHWWCLHFVVLHYTNVCMVSQRLTCQFLNHSFESPHPCFWVHQKALTVAERSIRYELKGQLCSREKARGVRFVCSGEC